MPRDTDFDACAQAFPEAVLALVGFSRTRGYRASSIALKAQSRAFDLVFTSRRRGAPTVCMEVQERGERTVERSALVKVVVYCTQHDSWDSTQLVIVYATEAARREALSATVAWRGRPSVAFSPERIVLTSIRPEALLVRGGALLGLLPLVGRGRLEERTREAFARLCADPTLSEPQRERLKDFFGRFLRRRTRGRLDVEDPVFLEKMKGVQWLVARGRAEGEAKGKAEGKAEAAAEALRSSIAAVLEARLGRPPRALLAALRATEETKRLDAALRVAATAEAFEEVTKALGRRSRRPASRSRRAGR